MATSLVNRLALVLSVVLAGLVSLGWTSAASAQQQPTGAVLTVRCVSGIQNTGEATRRAVRAASAQGVGVIIVADRNSASDEQLNAVATTALNAITTRSQAGVQRINQLADGCVAALNQIGAAAELIQRVNTARANQIQSITRASESASAAVAEALRIALNN